MVQFSLDELVTVAWGANALQTPRMLALRRLIIKTFTGVHKPYFYERPGRAKVDLDAK